jgi:hypothetical protein
MTPESRNSGGRARQLLCDHGNAYRNVWDENGYGTGLKNDETMTYLGQDTQ